MRRHYYVKKSEETGNKHFFLNVDKNAKKKHLKNVIVLIGVLTTNIS